jgi:hypothetical protein
MFDVIGKEKHEQHASQCLQQLAAVYGCDLAIQGRAIGSIYGRLKAFDSGLPQQLLCIVDKEKERSVDASIMALHPECMLQNLKPAEQMSHIQSAYLVRCGEELGLRGATASKLATSAPTLTDKQTSDFLDEFTRHFDTGEVVDAIVRDVNQVSPNQRFIDIDVLHEWVGDVGALPTTTGVASTPAASPLSAAAAPPATSFDKQSIWYNSVNLSKYKLTGPPPASSPAFDQKAPWIYDDVACEILKRCFTTNSSDLLS